MALYSSFPASLAPYLWIALGGALGALARYGLGTWCSELLGTGFPSGTLVVNLVGCLAIGVVICFLGGLDTQARELWRFALVIGFLGSFTTLSTFSYEQILLLGEGRYVAWFLYAAGNVLGGLLMVLAGIGIGKMIW